MRSPHGYVLDASVAAKWVLPPQNEPYVTEAMNLLEQFGDGKVLLSVPDLFWPEVGNILWKSARTGRITREAAQEAFDWLLELRLPTWPAEPIASAALAIANSFDRAVYDSLYLTLAIHTGRKFITADERFASAVALHAPVQWLGSYA